jgi:hypothetical protein
MAKSRKKTTRTKKPKKKAKPLPPAIRFIGRALPWLVVLALLGTAAWKGTVAGWDAIASRPEFQLELRAINLNGFPAWVNGPVLQKDLRASLSVLPPNASIFSKSAAAAVGETLGRCPWVVEVQAVQRQLPNRLTARVTFRKPVALATWGGKHYMVDRDGVPLPDSLFRTPQDWDRDRMPIVVDRLLRQPPPSGSRWDWPRMAVGARFADFLRGSGLLDQLQLVSIDVTGVGRSTPDPDIVLTAAGGAEIRWGGSSLYGEVGLEEPAFPPTDAEKLRMLQSKLLKYPGLRGIQYMDLRFHGQVNFRPEQIGEASEVAP